MLPTDPCQNHFLPSPLPALVATSHEHRHRRHSEHPCHREAFVPLEQHQLSIPPDRHPNLAHRRWQARIGIEHRGLDYRYRSRRPPLGDRSIAPRGHVSEHPLEGSQ